MSRRSFSHCARFRSFASNLALGATLLLGACGEGSSAEDADTSGTGGIGGPATTGGQANSVGGTSSNGSGGDTPMSGGAEAGGTSSGGSDGESAGGSDGQGSGGEGSGGDGSGGDGSGGDGSGGDGSGGAPSDECTRALLDGLLDDYFSALSAGDPSSLPLATTLKFTENAVESAIGTTDFWMNAGEVKYSQRALDIVACSAATHAVVPEGGMDLPIALRIEVEGAEITEIETIVVRPGDYQASYAVDSDTDEIIERADGIGWHDEVPVDQRATREELIGWIDNYFRSFPNGVCDVTSACVRLENGGGCNTGSGCLACGSGSCDSTPPASGGTLIPRVMIADVERGIAVGFTNFDFMASGHLDMHMMKRSGGEVHAVHAILRNTNGESGWE